MQHTQNFLRNSTEVYSSLGNEVSLLLDPKDDMEETEPEKNAKTQMQESIFYQYFHKKREEISKRDFVRNTGQGTKNDLYNPKVFDILQKNYIPYIGLWARFPLTMTRHPTFTRSTSAPVESYFRTVKNNYCRNGKQHIGDFVREM